MKLSLNLPALERLLGGDTELELELRHQIVENFTKHHLKKLVDTEKFKALEKEMLRVGQDIAAAANKEITDKIGKWTGGGWCGPYTVQLTEHIEKMVKDAAYEAVKNAIEKQVQYQADQRMKSLMQWIDKKVELVLQDNIKAKIEAGVQERLKKAMEN